MKTISAQWKTVSIVRKILRFWDFDRFDDPILPNFNTVVGNIWLELMKYFNATTKATCFIAENMSQIINWDRKPFIRVLRKSFVESGIREIGH